MTSLTTTTTYVKFGKLMVYEVFEQTLFSNNNKVI